MASVRSSGCNQKKQDKGKLPPHTPTYTHTFKVAIPASSSTQPRERRRRKGQTGYHLCEEEKKKKKKPTEESNSENRVASIMKERTMTKIRNV